MKILSRIIPREHSAGSNPQLLKITAKPSGLQNIDRLTGL